MFVLNKIKAMLNINNIETNIWVIDCSVIVKQSTNIATI
ncbi:hypothetical protein JCM19231_4819 [Vibrio ishigakensis]|uniref:Uncharacterized protein n=1 Tax=Vibrio ishigakensis TaxID=1481914 RepID=A0A0B8NWA0_9VIBR|nr:hypothetical protein JCM19231_4819 [Vibrio ishigakensis]